MQGRYCRGRANTRPNGETARKGKIRAETTENPPSRYGCISQINGHLYEGRYSPIDAHGNRTSRNVYAKTREECEIKLAEMIAEMKAEIKAEKEKFKAQQSA